jgi:hypothetical protein
VGTLVKAIACVVAGIAVALAMPAYGPKRLVFCQDPDALSDLCRWAAEPTIGIVHIDGGAGHYPSCYAPSALAWWGSLFLVLGGTLAGAYVVRRDRRSDARV